MSLLRPQFTQFLLETLKKESVNVFGAYGQGQSRLLIDLKQLALKQGFIVILVDMKPWAEDYEGLIREMSNQVQRQLRVVTEPINDLPQLITALDKHSASATVLFMLQNFDALLDNAVHLDDKYNSFFPRLNSIRNQQNRALLTITAKPYNQYRVYVNKIHNTSPLDLKRWELRTLSYDEVKGELQRRVSELTQQELNLLTRTIHQHSQAYEFLEYCIQQIKLGNEKKLNFNKRLKIWKKKFKDSYKNSFRRLLDKLLNWLTIAGKEIDSLSLKLKLLFISLMTLVTIIIKFFDEIAHITLFDLIIDWFR